MASCVMDWEARNVRREVLGVKITDREDTG